MSEPVLSLEGVSVEIGGRKLVENVSFTLGAGELVALIGPNGAGKTTLLRAILGELRFSGHIHLHGKIGYVPQRLAFDRSLPMTVLEFLALSVQRRPLALGVAARVRQSVGAMLERVGGASLLHKPLGGLSGGELQRVLLASALERKPALLLLDEPAAGVDIEGEAAFNELILREVREHQCAAILVSHDLSVVADMTDRVLCINRVLMCEGKADDLLTAETIARVFGGHKAVYDHHRPVPHVHEHGHDHRHEH
ncbi:MAG: metal ABC transporter ATP-binding protein [Planctomycetes bacterium]|jgi:zinc transport system ATP-binding protein|nr:metal ABC transporter ATP-binding protein [Planctomycetota bacterium]